MVVARPVSAFARQYVYDLELADAEEAASHSDKDEEDRPPSSGAEPAASDSESSLRGSSSSSDRTTIRVRWLLLPMPQTVLAAVLCGLTLVWGASWGAWAETVVALPIVALLGATCSVDAVCHRLPDRLLWPTATWTGAATLTLLILHVAAGTPLSNAAWIAARTILCALCAGLVIVAMIALIPWSGMGLGDAKLCTVLGLWLGYFNTEYAALGIILGFFIGGVAAIILMVTRIASRKTLIAFGPYLAAGSRWHEPTRPGGP